MDFKLHSTLKILFCSFVSSLIEYGVVIWYPTIMNDSYQLERIQHKFLKFVSFRLSIDCLPRYYNPVLCHLDLTTLTARRVQINLSLLT
ncbi:Uncharacterized protein FWK35_00008113 [Aphis craccivora]|uniref:Reverse transcriptase domain-containing protein n=1 Tax=Aphis craccivora TaxID=307492 RepID=A0A6G0YIX1_APHCR|nr:Uncharacterized protein FWK35_00008113 [Aphis craccivora]